MVAIHIPQLAPAASVPDRIVQRYKLDHRAIFMLHALPIGNEDRNYRFTCLGTAVTYSRRCRMPLHSWIEVLVEMIKAAEDRTIRLVDLKDDANGWGSRLSCYHHVMQTGPGVAVLGAVALYRDVFNPGCRQTWGPFSRKPGSASPFTCKWMADYADERKKVEEAFTILEPKVERVKIHLEQQVSE